MCWIVYYLFICLNNFVNYSEACMQIILEACLAKGHHEYTLFLASKGLFK